MGQAERAGAASGRRGIGRASERGGRFQKVARKQRKVEKKQPLSAKEDTNRETEHRRRRDRTDRCKICCMNDEMKHGARRKAGVAHETARAPPNFVKHIK